LVALTGAIAVVVAGMLASAPPSDGGVSLQPVRVIGGTGHAEHYGWGQDTIPAGFPGAGNVLATDYWNYRVTEFDSAGNFVRHVINKDGKHLSPYDVAVNPVNGNVAIGDVDGGLNVDIYSLSGTYLRSCGDGTLWTYPGWLDYDDQGRLAVADSRGHKVVVLDDATCAVTVRFGTSGSGTSQFRTPRGIDWGPDGTLWISDVNNRRIVQWRVGATSATFVSQFPVAGADNRGLVYNRDNDQLYLVNASAATIDRYTTSGTKIGSFGGYGTALGRFVDGGRGITVDGDGGIWVGDMSTFRSQKFSAAGTPLMAYPRTASPPPLGGYNNPGSVAVMEDGTIAGLDSFNWRVNIHNADGTPRLAFGTRSVLNYPRGIAPDRSAGMVVVANSDGQKVERWTLNGTRLWQVPGIQSFAVAVDQVDGTAYAAQQNRNVVTPVSRTGTVLSSFGSGHLNNPRGVAVDPGDRSIWVSNQATGKIAHFSREGVFLGSFVTGSSQAADLEVSAAGIIYLADQKANVIRMFTTTGTSLGSFGGAGTALGKLKGPMGMDLLGDRLYVMERVGERIQEFRIVSS
jgi:DNA-binding beta-propeller fold protein YncE